MATTGKQPPSAVSHTLPHALPVAGQQLFDELFDGQPNALAKPVAFWLATSKPFLAFLQTYLSKVRKKVRMSRDVEETYNLYCELRTAYLLLQEPKFAVAYEPYGLREGRSADFAVTFRTNTVFHVEVTRLRASHQEQQLTQQKEASLEEQTNFIRRYESRRLTDVVCEKFGQLSSDTPNVLWVWGKSRVVGELDVGEVMLDLKRRVEQRDAYLFSRYGFGKPADFIRYYQRLSAIVVQCPYEQGANRSPFLWQNNDARHPLPAKVATLLRSLIAADSSLLFTANSLDEASGK